MSYDFDTPIERRGTDSAKWRRYAGRDVLPMWVADMDFASPPAVLEALHARADHGVFGYTAPPDSVNAAVAAMLARDHGWAARPEWLVWSPGLVVALNVICRMLDASRPGVMTTVPIYPPFLSAPTYTGRPLTTVPLLDRDGRYRLDLDRIRDGITDETGLFILCNPHNPAGRVWSRAELAALADICLARGVLICSDEIHCGLILDTDKTHVPIAMLSAAAADNTITLHAPSKTFNLPGLMCGCSVIPNPALRRRFLTAARGIVNEVNCFGFAACEAAYTRCADWHAALLAYLCGNRDRVTEAIGAIDGLRMNPVEATYLAWIDCREAGLDRPGAFFEKHGVGLSDGTHFGTPGFVRLNFGCPRATLTSGLERMRTAMAQR